MKTKHYLVAAAVGMLTLGAGSAMAFHGGGVAHCDGCHSMHNSADNPIGDAATENVNLLKGTDASSTCLNCHNGNGGYHVNSTNGRNTNAGGDFFWLDNGYFGGHSGTDPYAGDNAGHNVIASDFGLDIDGDANNQTAPGSSGAYSASLLGCTSCHDAHGQVHNGTAGGNAPVGVSGSYSAAAPANSIKGNYRLLGDSDYEAGATIGPMADNFAFTNDAPVALTDGSTGTYVRYGSGMSEWCGNCHDLYQVDTGTVGKHPNGAGATLGATIAANYNSYVASGDFTGTSATSYDAFVPFETGTTDQSTLTYNSTQGPTATAQVMCLSCHRAHASAFNNMGRWDFNTEFVAEADVFTEMPGTVVMYGDNATIGSSAAMAGRYNAEQRSLCNKCHVQD